MAYVLDSSLRYAPLSEDSESEVFHNKESDGMTVGAGRLAGSHLVRGLVCGGLLLACSSERACLAEPSFDRLSASAILMRAESRPLSDSMNVIWLFSIAR